MRTVLHGSLLLTLALAGLTERAARTDADPAPSLAGAIEERLAGRTLPGLEGDGETLRLFYARRGFAPAWAGPEGIGPQALALFAALDDAGHQGLEPEDYGRSALARPLAAAGAPQSPDALAILDLRLSAAFLACARDLSAGKAKRAGHDRRTPQTAVDPEERLATALTAGRVREALRELAPSDPAYLRLVQALARYRALAAAGGWSPLPSGETRAGERSAAAAALRRRLAAEGDLPASPSSADTDLFDAALAQGLARFQERAGLPASGALDAATRAALDVPVETRVRQLLANLERWRWLPRDLGERHVLVNIPDYRLEVVSGGRTELAMRAIVGTPARATPGLSVEAVSVVLHPHWNIPRRILEGEILPKAARDPGYLARHGYEVIERAEGPPRVRQRPGPGNALGQIKIHLDNSPAIYLHDTPGRHRFAYARRALSHGCVRLEKPLDLAVALLDGDPAETRERLTRMLAKQEERWLPLPHRIPVHLVYFTAWADEAGTVHFRPDVYRRDPALFALFEKPAAAMPQPERPAARGGFNPRSRAAVAPSSASPASD